MTDPGAYKMRTVSRLTGFSPALLRAWERRHGLLRPRRTPGGHRLYTADDLRVLERVRELLDAGRSIGEIAHLGRTSLLERPPEPEPPPPREASAPNGGAAPLDEAAESLADAAAALDRPAVDRTLDRAFALGGVEAVLDGVVAPGLVRVGELWAAGRCSVAGEHMLGVAVRARLLALLDASNPRSGAERPRAVCACFPNEQHEGGALFVAYHLARSGYRVLFLGAGLPVADLDVACAAVEPHEVHLSVARPEVLDEGRPELVELVRRRRADGKGRGGPAFYVGGQGVRGRGAALAEAGVRVVPPVPLARLPRALAGEA